jgi:hypothetical protein
MNVKEAIVRHCSVETLQRAARGHAKNADGSVNADGLGRYLEQAPVIDLLTLLDIDELRAVCRSLELPAIGLRTQLISALRHYDPSATGEAPIAPVRRPARSRPHPTGLWPRSAPRSDNRGERRVWESLSKHLPHGWTAWHSLRVRVPQGQDGELDFVVAVPGRGVLLLECKGGKLAMTDGRWTQNGHPLNRAPREQALEARKKLVGVLEHRFPGQPRPFMAVAAIFPETAWATDFAPRSADLHDAVLGAHDLGELGAALPALAERLLQPTSDEHHPEWVDALHELWGEHWVPAPNLGALTALREERRVQLDTEQLAAIRSVERNERAFVLGGAGTGKTIIACQIAKAWAQAGHRPLYLCFTEALANEVRSTEATLRTDDERPLWHSWTVRRLAAHVLQSLSIDPADGRPLEEWRSEVWDLLPPLASGILPFRPLPYDCVVVDEAQDLAEEDWAFVRALVAKGQPLWVFGDPSQGFWNDTRCIPPDMMPFTYELTSRYRCPPDLAAFADSYATGSLDDVPSCSEESLQLVALQPGETLEQACDREVRSLLQSGVRPEQIAILSMSGLRSMSLANVRQLGGSDTVRADAPNARSHVVIDTFLRFKGLERPWILLVDIGRGSGDHAVRMHIALTRATVACRIVASPEAIAAEPRLARVAQGRGRGDG